MEFIMGGTIMFGGNFAPKDWAFCDNQLIAISQNQALFAILGTTWGGDGRTSFALPDLRGRVPLGTGRGPGLTDSILGRGTGRETVTLTNTQLPTHAHTATFAGTGGSSGSAISATATVNANSGTGNADNSTGNYWAAGEASGRAVTKSYSSTAGTTMASDAVTVAISGGGGGITGGTVTVDPTGGNSPFSIMQPSLGMNYIIAVQGTFPSRN